MALCSPPAALGEVAGTPNCAASPGESGDQWLQQYIHGHGGGRSGSGPTPGCGADDTDWMPSPGKRTARRPRKGDSSGGHIVQAKARSASSLKLDGSFATHCDALQRREQRVSPSRRLVPVTPGGNAHILWEAVFASRDPAEWPRVVNVLRAVESPTCEFVVCALRYSLLPALLFAHPDDRAWDLLSTSTPAAALTGRRATALTGRRATLRKECWCQLVHLTSAYLREYPILFLPEIDGSGGSHVASPRGGAAAVVDPRRLTSAKELKAVGVGAVRRSAATMPGLRPPRHRDVWSMLFEVAAEVVEPLLQASPASLLSADATLTAEALQGVGSVAGDLASPAAAAAPSQGGIEEATTAQQLLLQRCVPDWELVTAISRSCAVHTGRSSGDAVLDSPYCGGHRVAAWILMHVIHDAATAAPPAARYRGNPERSCLWASREAVDPALPSAWESAPHRRHDGTSQPPRSARVIPGAPLPVAVLGATTHSTPALPPPPPGTSTSPSTTSAAVRTTAVDLGSSPTPAISAGVWSSSAAASVDSLGPSLDALLSYAITQFVVMDFERGVRAPAPFVAVVRVPGDLVQWCRNRATSVFMRDVLLRSIYCDSVLNMTQTRSAAAVTDYDFGLPNKRLRPC